MVHWTLLRVGGLILLGGIQPALAQAADSTHETVLREVGLQMQLLAQGRREALEADVSDRESAVRRYKATFDRLDRLIRSGSTSEKSVYTAEWQYELAEIELKRHRKRILEAQAEENQYARLPGGDARVIAEAGVTFERRRSEVAEIGVEYATRELKYRERVYQSVLPISGVHPVGSMAEIMADRALATDSLADAKRLAVGSKRRLILRLERLPAGMSWNVPQEIAALRKAVEIQSKEADEIDAKAEQLKTELDEFNRTN